TTQHYFEALREVNSDAGCGQPVASGSSVELPTNEGKQLKSVYGVPAPPSVDSISTRQHSSGRLVREVAKSSDQMIKQSGAIVSRLSDPVNIPPRRDRLCSRASNLNSTVGDSHFHIELQPSVSRLLCEEISVNTKPFHL
ncbi:hypothetical protein AHF37_11098, partial [Paragonimus kellicotti]